MEIFYLDFYTISRVDQKFISSAQSSILQLLVFKILLVKVPHYPNPIGLMSAFHPRVVHCHRKRQNEIEMEWKRKHWMKLNEWKNEWRTKMIELKWLNMNQWTRMNENQWIYMNERTWIN